MWKFSPLNILASGANILSVLKSIGYMVATLIGWLKSIIGKAFQVNCSCLFAEFSCNSSIGGTWFPCCLKIFRTSYYYSLRKTLASVRWQWDSILRYFNIRLSSTVSPVNISNPEKSNFKIRSEKRTPQFHFLESYWDTF